MAFKASRLVCSAMSWITSITLPISSAAVPSWPIVSLLPLVSVVAVSAMRAACSAVLAISPILLVSSLTAVTTELTLFVICSVAVAMPRMLVDISSAAAATVVDWALVSSAPLASCEAVAESCVEVLASWPALRVRSVNTSCRFFVMLLTAVAILLNVLMARRSLFVLAATS